MNKVFISLASVMVTTGASAQSNVALFGIIDTGVAHVRTAGQSVTALTNSGSSYSRLGFRGSEDLGGDLKAGFWLEGALSTDAGEGFNPRTTLTFQRRATVSLSGGFGELRLGRDFATSYYNPAWFDPFQGTGIGQPTAYLMLGAPIRISNAVSYFLPNTLGGVYGQVQYAFGEEPASSPNSKRGTYTGLRLGYANKQLNVSASVAELKTGTPTTPADVKVANLGASYDFGVVKPMAFWAMEKNSAGARIDALLLGATAPIGGAGELRAAYSRYDRKSSPDDWRKLSIGYLHTLSKRTAVYGTYAYVKNSGDSAQMVSATGLGNAPITQSLTAAPGGHSSGLEFGIRHIF